MTATVSVLRFSAKPELHEHVNIALLVSSGRGSDMVYDPDFPRLMCAAPQIRKELVKAHLEALRATFAETRVDDLATRLAALSPQFALGGQHTIPAELTPEHLKQLKSAFLSRERGHHSRDEQGPRISSMVGDFMIRRLGIDPTIAKRTARIGALLGSAGISRQLAHMKVPRAIVGKDHVVLVDGLSFRAAHGYLRNRADRIRFMGFGLHEAQHRIRSETGLSVHCGTVLFDEPNIDFDEEQRYVVRQVQEYTTLLSSKPGSDVSKFAALTRQVAGSII